MSQSDNPFVRFAAFWWGIGVISLFFVVLLVTRAFVGGDDPDPLEEQARINRLKVRNEVDAAQSSAFEVSVVEEGKTVQLPPEAVFAHIGEQLLKAKPTKVEDPAQVVPGTATAEAIAQAGGEADTEGVDALTPPAGTEPDAAVMETGKQQYMVCMACHGANGEGVNMVGPPLANSEWVAGPVSNLIRIQFRGLGGPITVAGKEYNFPAPMAPMGAASSNEDLAAVLTYIRNSFGNSAPPVLPEQVEMLRSEIGKPTLTVEDLIAPAPES